MTVSERQIERRLERLAASIAVPAEHRWVPASTSRGPWRYAFAALAAALVVATALALASLQPSRIVPLRQPDMPKDGAPLRIGTLTINERSCSFDGAAQIRAGQVLIDVVNRGTLDANVHLLEIDGAHTYAELAAHVDAERASLATGDMTRAPFGVPPVWAVIKGEAVTGGAVPAGAQASITSLVWPAQHAIGCFWFDQTKLPRMQRMDLVGPLEVVP